MTNAACRSRWTICVLTGSTCRPSSASTSASTSGGNWLYVPTGPEILPVAISVVACARRRRPRADLERPAGQLEPERDGLRVDRVRPAHLDRARLFAGAADEDGEERIGVSQQQLARGAQLERETGVDDVAARQPEVEIPAVRADGLGDLADERDDVVVGRALDLGDALGVDAGARLDGRQRSAGTTPRRGLRSGHGQLDVEHPLEPRRIGPDRAHLGAGCSARIIGRLRRLPRLRRRPGRGRRRRDVVAALEPAARDPLGGRLGPRARFREVRAAADDGHDPAAVRSEPASRRRGASPAWKTRAPSPLAPDPDRVATPRLLGIAARWRARCRRSRPAARQPRRSVGAAAPRARRQQQRRRARPRVAAGSTWASGSPRRALHSRSPARRRSASGPRRGTRGTACRAARAPRGAAGGRVSRIASIAASSRSGERRVRAHPAGVRSVVAVEQPLVVSRGRQRDGAAAVAHRDHARLGARRAAPR